MNPTLRAAVQSAVQSATGTPLGDFTIERAGGGSIHQSHVLRGARSYFVKVNAATRGEMFEAESDSLRALAATGSVRVPDIVASGVVGEWSFLVLELLHLRSGSEEDFARLGRQLAALHRNESPDKRFGWARDNFIGATPQENVWMASWLEFWRHRRLEPQLKWAAEKGVRFAGADRWLDGLETFFTDYQPLPSLVHGDLWGGNASFLPDGTPVIYDPAVYYGDRETDLAFTEFFGGFPQSFYEAYDDEFPRHKGSRSRRDLYNLYHVLNHFNLFGGHYGSQAQEMIGRLMKSSPTGSGGIQF